MSRCNKCVLHERCQSVLVPPNDVSGMAKIMLIMDFPDKTDDRFGKTMYGDTFKKLLWYCEKTGLDIDDFYITYAVKCRSENKKIKKEIYETCRDNYLIGEILKVRPKLIIACGNVPLLSLLNKESISDFRGYFENLNIDYTQTVGGEKKALTFKTKILPIYSIQASMWEWTHDIYNLHDLKKAYKFLKTGQAPELIEPEFVWVDSLEKLEDFRNTMLSEVKYCGVDFETTGLDFWRHRIINSGYCTDKHKIFIVPQLEYTKKSFVKKWSEDDINLARKVNKFVSANKEKIREVLKEVHGSDIKWILHNGKFDQKFARSHRMPFKNFFFDTMLADSLIDENRAHYLNSVVEFYGYNFGPYDTYLWPYVGKKSKKSYQHVPVSMLNKYLAIDVLATMYIFEKQIPMLKKENLLEHFMQVKMVSLKQVLDSEFRGVKADRQFLINAQNTVVKEIDSLVQRAKEITKNDKFKMSSPKQVLEYFKSIKLPFEKLGITKTKTGYSTDKANLAKIMKVEKYAELPTIMTRFSALDKLRGTYLCGDVEEDSENDGDGGLIQYLDTNDRIHTNYNLQTAVTGRQSASSPSTQVWPRPIKGLPNIRNCLIPSTPDHVFFEADYKQLEMAVVANLSGDRLLLQRIRDGVDLHCLNAITLGKKLKIVDPEITYEYMMVAVGKGEEINSKIDPSTIPADVKDTLKKLRTNAKNLAFGLNYGKEADTFASEFGISKEDARQMVIAYFEDYSGLYEWRNMLVEQVFSFGYVKLKSGRKRRFTEVVDWLNSEHSKKVFSAKIIRNEIIRQVYNFPVQGGAHEVFEPQYIECTKEFKKQNLSSIFLLYIHDGLVGECHKNDAKQTMKILNEKLPIVLSKGKKNELYLGVDTDLYKVGGPWYGEKQDSKEYA